MKLNLKQIITRAKKVGVNSKEIAYILDMDHDYIADVLQRNGLWYNKMPGKMPDSYYTERLSQGLSVTEMARELNCSTSAIYATLKIRGINQDAYRIQAED